MLNFVKCFLCDFQDDRVVSFFPFVNVVYHIDLCMLNHPYDSGMIQFDHGVWSLLHIIEFSLLMFHGRIFASTFIKDIGL